MTDLMIGRNYKQLSKRIYKQIYICKCKFPQWKQSDLRGTCQFHMTKLVYFLETIKLEHHQDMQLFPYQDVFIKHHHHFHSFPLTMEYVFLFILSILSQCNSSDN